MTTKKCCDGVFDGAYAASTPTLEKVFINKYVVVAKAVVVLIFFRFLLLRAAYVIISVYFLLQTVSTLRSIWSTLYDHWCRPTHWPVTVAYNMIYDMSVCAYIYTLLTRNSQTTKRLNWTLIKPISTGWRIVWYNRNYETVAVRSLFVLKRKNN